MFGQYEISGKSAVHDHDICLFNGRMRPVTEAHVGVIVEGLEHAQYVFVTVGSVNEPINFRNPFTFEQVYAMLRASLTPMQNDRVFIFGIEDQQSDMAWVRTVQKTVATQAARLFPDREAKIALIGHAKDASSYYLKLFPKWASIAATVKHKGLDATTLRNDLYRAADPTEYVRKIHADVPCIPIGPYLFLREWVHSSDFEQMRAEYLFMAEYLDLFERNPFTGERQQFPTSDMVVKQAGYTLLVRRDRMPGEGLWAVPGGHKLAKQTFRGAALDEVGQETGIYDLNEDIDREFMNLCIRGEKMFDDPWRSTRETTFSMSHGALLPGTRQPIVKGADDAREARWWADDEITRSMMFEDHFNQVQYWADQFRNIVI
ncbi:NUDIX domain-containing protein [Sphingobium sp. MK2]|uniref:NUDIX domain-containing protein n=1 Tax=Sphingobium sp. MK2 TaxID=3116540 RepID=UPI0032E35B71